MSKAALEALAKTYANETADSAIKVNLIDPGATATRMRAEAYPGEDQATLPTPEEVAERFVAAVAMDRSFTETGNRASSRPGSIGVSLPRFQHHAVIGRLDALRQLARAAPHNRDRHAYA